MRRLVVVATVVACLTALTSGTTSAAPSATEAPAVAAATTPASTAAPEDEPRTTERRRKNFVMRPGITLNNPLGSKKKKYAVLNKIHKAIRKTPRGQTIKVMSWNIMWMKSADLLLKAQRRGVQLRILMDQENYSREVPNPSWRKLRSGIKKYNKRLPKAKRSYAKVCKKACRRGNAGAAHAKYFLFSRVGRTPHVVIQGGNNLTLASAINQWNEVYTFTEDARFFAWMTKIYGQMWADRMPKKPWTRYQSSSFDMYFSPQVKNYRVGQDPLEIALANTKCTGVSGGAGNKYGRTIIRSAPDVIRGKRGMRVARLIRAKWNQGCDVKIAYTILGKDIYRYLRNRSGRGPVPIRHVVQDYNGDKEFDRYFHLKVWTINGKVFGDSSYYWAMNGSTNISNYSAGSDENFAVFKDRRGITRRYQQHIEYWFNNPPPSRPVVRSLIKGPVDPYRNVDLD